MGRQIVSKADIRSAQEERASSESEATRPGLITTRDRKKALPERGRAIAPSRDVTEAESALPIEPDNYATRLLKYIPAEIVGLYITSEAVIRASSEGTSMYALMWIVFLFGLVMTPLYLHRVTKVTRKSQLLVSTVAFGIWVFALGGPFEVVDWYKPLYGGLLLPAFTLVVAVYEGKKSVA